MNGRGILVRQKTERLFPEHLSQVVERELDAEAVCFMLPDQKIDAAIDVLSTSKYTKAEDREAVVSDLRKWKKRTSVVILILPLGLLVYRSGFLPRILGVALMVNCFAFLISSLTSLVLPHYEALVHGWMRPFHFGEQAFMLWLLIMGAKPRPLASPAYCATPS